MAVSSLVPGILFKSTGLNTSHTPTEVTAGPEAVKAKYRRASIPDKKWPPESPVARIYDVRNTSSRLILLNNSMDQKKSHLRVQSGRYRSTHSSDEGRQPEPDRHTRSTSPTNISRHKKCLDSTAPRYTPTPSQAPYNTSQSERSKSNRYPQVPADGHQVLDWHHYSSQPDSRRRVMSAPPTRSNRTPRSKERSREIVPPPSFKRDKDWLQHPDMTKGQMRYANSIAKVYDMTNMKQLKQAQYVQLIHREQQRGFFTPENYRKYLMYLNSDRIRQFGVCAPPSTLVRTSKTPRTPKTPRANSKSKIAQNSHETSPKPVDKRQSGSNSTLSSRSEERSPREKSASRNNRLKEQDTDKNHERHPSPDNRSQDQDKHTTGDPEPNTEKRALRPKSSKYRQREDTEQREQKTCQRRQSSTSSSSSSLSSSDNSTRNQSQSPEYWKQPPPPTKEKEPDGEGLTMTENQDLNKKGETLEITGVRNVEDETRKQKKSPNAKDQERTETSSPGKPTYDVEDEEGRKTRVYQESDMDKRPNSRLDDTPIVKETGQLEESRESPPLGRKELTKELLNKELALQSDSD